jgi:hypothetical protein
MGFSYRLRNHRFRPKAGQTFSTLSESRVATLIVSAPLALPPVPPRAPLSATLTMMLAERSDTEQRKALWLGRVKYWEELSLKTAERLLASAESKPIARKP